MIDSRTKLYKCVHMQKSIYPLAHKLSYKITKEPIVFIAKAQKHLRLAEYYKNCKKNILGNFLYLYHRKRKNRFDRLLGNEIPINVFDEGLMIYHGNNIINSYAKVGKNCKLHGGVVIGNKGDSDLNCPKIGDNVDIGYGAVIIGNISIGNNVIIGANTLVNKNIKSDSIVVGNPFRIIERK